MNKYTLSEVFADNGEHSHWQLLNENGESIWREGDELKNAALKKRVEELEAKNKALLEFMQSQYSIKSAYEKSIYEAIIKDKPNPQ